MKLKYFLLALFLCCTSINIETKEETSNNLEAKALILKKYIFINDPIDVVIPSAPKDVEILNLCINGIKKNCYNVRRIIVVSNKKLTDEAEWFDEKLYPFSKLDVGIALFNGDVKKGQAWVRTPYWGGWYYQQLLKLYAPYVIPGISQNVLLLDSDTVFLRPVKFLNKNYAGLYNPGSEYVKTYFEHMARFVPGLKKLYPQYSGISHHMLFQRSVLDNLFDIVETTHKKPLWKAFCQSVQRKNPCIQGASEYEIYFNFLFTTSNQASIRVLKWQNVDSVENLEKFRQQGYHYVSCHSWLRDGRNPSIINPFKK